MIDRGDRASRSPPSCARLLSEGSPRNGGAALAFVGMSSEADHRFLGEMEATRPEREYGRAMLQRRGVRWHARGDLEVFTLNLHRPVHCRHQPCRLPDQQTTDTSTRS